MWERAAIRSFSLEGDSSRLTNEMIACWGNWLSEWVSHEKKEYKKRKLWSREKTRNDTSCIQRSSLWTVPLLVVSSSHVYRICVCAFDGLGSEAKKAFQVSSYVSGSESLLDVSCCFCELWTQVALVCVHALTKEEKNFEREKRLLWTHIQRELVVPPAERMSSEYILVGKEKQK